MSYDFRIIQVCAKSDFIEKNVKIWDITYDFCSITIYFDQWKLQGTRLGIVGTIFGANDQQNLRKIWFEVVK